MHTEKKRHRCDQSVLKLRIDLGQIPPRSNGEETDQHAVDLLPDVGVVLKDPILLLPL